MNGDDHNEVGVPLWLQQAMNDPLQMSMFEKEVVGPEQVGDTATTVRPRVQTTKGYPLSMYAGEIDPY
jgi:hypothetical protein